MTKDKYVQGSLKYEELKKSNKYMFLDIHEMISDIYEAYDNSELPPLPEDNPTKDACFKRFLISFYDIKSVGTTFRVHYYVSNKKTFLQKYKVNQPSV